MSSDERPPHRALQRAHYIRLTIAYDGHPFHGIARQQNARTVAGELDGAIREMDPRALPVRCASRTDAGVHARHQVVIFGTDKVIDSRGWVLGLNQHLPDEIAVVQAARMSAALDPSVLARRKTYRYLVLRSDHRDPFWTHRAWRVHQRLNQKLMEQEATALLGEHDFVAFRGARDERTETVRTILRAEVRTLLDDPRVLVLEIEGNRFLYNMVRIIAGTLVDVGRGRLEPGAVERGLRTQQREVLGMTAPPGGLYLQHIDLADHGLEPWPADDPV